jgi:DnaK suppressor protein
MDRSHKTGSKRAGKSRSQFFRARLLNERQRLASHLKTWMANTVESSGRRSADDADLASVGVDQETFCQLGSAESDAVAQIDAALEKLETGSYGVCEECGEKISPARLKALPFAAVCVNCKSQQELTDRVNSQFEPADISLGILEDSGFIGEEAESLQHVRGNRRPE